MDKKHGQFRHYLITAFNVGIYDPASKLYHCADKWTEHRIKLFATFTLPSVMGQSCQNFTWLVFADKRTPQDYKNMLENIDCDNMRISYLNAPAPHNDIISNAVLDNIQPGDYDLITTELDSDDALHIDTIKQIQYWYAHRPEPWMIVFPQGLILDLPSQQLFILEYQYHVPTLIERSTNANTVSRWDNSEIPVKVKEYIFGTPYWLQIIHSRNAGNDMVSTPSRFIHNDKPIPLDQLTHFTVNAHAIRSYGENLIAP